MKTTRNILLVAGVGILSVAGLGALSIAHSAGQCGIGGGEVKEGDHPDCASVGKEQGDECASKKSASARVTAADVRDAGNPQKAENEGPVNVKCPITGAELDKEGLTDELMVEHRGHSVGLCCDKCPGPWDELSEGEKDEKLAESIELRWHSSPDEALAEAKHRKGLVVAEFHAEWCGWCQKWEAETLPDRDVQLRLLDFSLLKIDTDEQPAVARQFGVTGLPTTVVLDSKGEVVLRHSGFNDADQYLALLAEAAMEAGVARPVNTTCPIMTGSELDKEETPKELLAVHSGRIVGFCCPSCIDVWEALSEEEKDEKLGESL